MLGYKCFYKGLINRYGKKFSLGKIYVTEGAIRFGNNGNGFHLCKNMEDTFRYFDRKKEITICLVEGSGRFQEYSDEYYGYYDLYAFEKIQLLKELTREEIIAYGLHLPSMQVERFVSLYPLTVEERALFREKFKNNQQILKTISYYQDGNSNAFHI